MLKRVMFPVRSHLDQGASTARPTGNTRTRFRVIRMSGRSSSECLRFGPGYASGFRAVTTSVGPSSRTFVNSVKPASPSQSAISSKL